jgi:GH15 family glucan-1,4-alpha-glucosidase
LPETIGEVRNWDYRYCWLRDSSLVLEAMARIGQFDEMRGFVQFLLGVFESKQTKVQIAYRIDGSPDLDEEILPHLAGSIRDRCASGMPPAARARTTFSARC